MQENYLKDDKNSILVKDGWRAWGYLQTLYHRNIYCTALYTDERLNQIAHEHGINYIVNLQATQEYGDTSCYTKARITDVDSSDVFLVSIVNGEISEEEMLDIYVADLTDDNWTKGILNTNTTEILFNYTSYNYSKLSGAAKIYCNDNEYEIISMDNDSNWIHVYVDKDATECGYPNAISVGKE